MNTNIPSIWKQQVSMPVAAMAIAISIVTTLAAFEHQTGLPASIRSGSVYGAMPVHGAAATSAKPAVIRRTSSTSSMKSLSESAKKRLRGRLIQRRTSSGER